MKTSDFYFDLPEELIAQVPLKNRTDSRLLVLDNIAMALQAGDHFRKVEVSDPEITAEDVKRVILPFDNEKRKFMKQKNIFSQAELEVTFFFAEDVITTSNIFFGEEDMLPDESSDDMLGGNQ